MPIRGASARAEFDAHEPPERRQRAGVGGACDERGARGGGRGPVGGCDGG